MPAYAGMTGSASPRHIHIEMNLLRAHLPNVERISRASGETNDMATTRQRAAARRNIRKATSARTRKRRVAKAKRAIGRTKARARRTTARARRSTARATRRTQRTAASIPRRIKSTLHEIAEKASDITS